MKKSQKRMLFKNPKPKTIVIYSHPIILIQKKLKNPNK